MVNSISKNKETSSTIASLYIQGCVAICLCSCVFGIPQKRSPTEDTHRAFHIPAARKKLKDHGEP